MGLDGSSKGHTLSSSHSSSPSPPSFLTFSHTDLQCPSPTPLTFSLLHTLHGSTLPCHSPGCVLWESPSCLLICFNWKWRMSVITILQSELRLSNSSIQMYVWKEDILAGYSTVYKQYSYAFWFLSPFCLQNPYFSLSFHGSLELQGKGEVRMMIILW